MLADIISLTKAEEVIGVGEWCKNENYCLEQKNQEKLSCFSFSLINSQVVRSTRYIDRDKADEGGIDYTENSLNRVPWLKFSLWFLCDFSIHILLYSDNNGIGSKKMDRRES